MKLLSALLLSAIMIVGTAGLCLAQRSSPEEVVARQLTADQGLFFALAAGDIDQMAVLRDQGADPNIRLDRLGLKARDLFSADQPIFKEPLNPAGWPILTWAVYLGDLNAVKLLLRAGARVNTPDEYGATALHWAAWGGRYEIAQLLLNNGAACLSTDLKGRTPKDWAVMMGQGDLVRLLDGRDCRPAPFRDQDGDGVPDDQDQCPDTPLGASVDDRGCWVVAYANFFDFDKADIKAQYLPNIIKAARVIQSHPELNIDIVGHTDSAGTAEYNYKLGLRRAESVRAVLVANGVAAARLGLSSMGESEPIANNALAAGRALNRRVELRIKQLP